MKLKSFFLLACAVPASSANGQTESDRVATKGFAMFAADDTFHPYEFTRHAVGDNDIQIDIMYDKAWKNGSDGNVKFRYVIDISTIK